MFVGDIFSHVLLLGLGFVGGVLVGQFLRKVVIDDMEKEEVQLSRRITLTQIYGITTVVLTMLALVTVFFSVQEQQRVTACQARYNAHFTAAVSARATAAANDRNAQIKLSQTMVELIESSTQPGRSPEDKLNTLNRWKAAQQEYITTLSNSDKERAENQYPIPPRCE